MIIELSIKFVQLVHDCQKHHPPLSYGEVVVLLDNPSGDVVVVFRSGEEVKICTEVVILNFQLALFVRGRYRLEHFDSLLDAVLQLQIVDKNQFFLQPQRLLLLDHRGQKLVVCSFKVYVEYPVFPFLSHGMNPVIDHGIVFKVGDESNTSIALFKCDKF